MPKKKGNGRTPADLARDKRHAGIARYLDGALRRNTSFGVWGDAIFLASASKCDICIIFFGGDPRL